jgi:peptidyl-prolyl cis-trans isomerase A (cyclophilin A)
MNTLLLRLILVATISLGLLAGAQAETTRVLMKTSMGDIELELDGDKAPESVSNFLKYVDQGFYNGTIFHRVMKGFMIQGGGFSQDLQRKQTNAPIQNEAKNGLKNSRGTIAMARTRAPHSATAQFFINHVDNANLDYPSFDGWGYAVFGKVTQGMEVVDQIANVPTGSTSGMQNVPNTPVIIESVSRLQ